MIEPYELHLSSTTKSYRGAWGERVVADLASSMGGLEGKTIEVHAGAAYVEPIRPCIATAGAELVDGYAPFCKHLFLENDTPTPCSFAPITDDNRALLQSGYAARREGELAVLERWFEGLEAPRAKYLDVILYSRAQLEIEAADGPDKDDLPDCDWGIVSVIGTLAPSEPPMPPITQMRNSLGTAEGGSGVETDREAYEKAVAFWDVHAAVR